MGSQKLRSTSKVIESLQEKLASPPRRADADRLLRMKEVSSVSRMRLLSSRSAESMEDAKEERGPGVPPGGLGSLTREDLACKEENGLSVSKGALSWEENRHLAAGREKRTMDQDFWCPGEESGKRADVHY